MSGTTLWWVRHGPTHARTMIGWTDLAADLSDTAAIARLSAALPTGAPVISSDLIRARATADALASDRPRLPDDPDLRELHFGAWEGLDFDAIPDSDQALLRAFWDQPGTHAAPDGESWDMLRARIDRARSRLEGIAADVIVVAHMGPILAQVQHALGITAFEAFGHRIAPLSLTTVDPGALRRIGELP